MSTNDSHDQAEAQRVEITDDQLLDVYLSGWASGIASALAISLPASIAVSTALAQTRGQRAHLMEDPLCRTSVIDGLHMMLRGEQLPPPHRSGCDYRWNGRAK